MQEYKIILTWEAIYDVTDIADYIEEEFGQQRADRFQSDLKEQMQNLGQFSTAFPRTQILYRGYSIHKRSFPPSIIFYIIMEETKEIHILRVLRHERDWENILLQTSVYKGYKQDKIEMRGDRAEMSDFPLYLNTVAGGLDRRDQTIGGFSFVVKIYAVPVVEIIR